MERHSLHHNPARGRPLLEHVGGFGAERAGFIGVERPGLRQSFGEPSLRAQPGRDVLHQRVECAVGNAITLHATLGQQSRPAHRRAQMTGNGRQRHFTDAALVIPRGKTHQVAPLVTQRGQFVPDRRHFPELGRVDFAALRQFPDDAHDLPSSERYLYQLPRAGGLVEAIVEQREQRGIERDAGDGKRTGAAAWRGRSDSFVGGLRRKEGRFGEIVGAGQT